MEHISCFSKAVYFCCVINKSGGCGGVLTSPGVVIPSLMPRTAAVVGVVVVVVVVVEVDCIARLLRWGSSHCG